MEKNAVGIWGFGIVGKAAIHFFSTLGISCEVIDARELTETERSLIKTFGGTCTRVAGPHDCTAFLERHATVLVSPGIDTRAYTAYKHKFIAELDLFFDYYKKPIIAITGSVGKTSVTHLLSQILLIHEPGWWTGGNIGTGVLELLASNTPSKGALIEVSSFQLDQCVRFAPDLAVITNIYPNHIDRHGSYDAYIAAKKNICAYQTAGQLCLVPYEARHYFADNAKHDDADKPSIHYVSSLPVAACDCQQMPSSACIFYSEHGDIYVRTKATVHKLADKAMLPTISFPENWLIIVAILYLKDIPIDIVSTHKNNFTLPEHRLEKLGTKHGLAWYNDSKSTTMASTLAAVKRLSGPPIILILGGLGKGVDRGPLIQAVKSYVAAIICFGAEADALAQACALHGVRYRLATTLDSVIEACLDIAEPGSQVLFSPAGSSFDQFANYQQRGSYFKACVERL